MAKKLSKKEEDRKRIKELKRVTQKLAHTTFSKKELKDIKKYLGDFLDDNDIPQDSSHLDALLMGLAMVDIAKLETEEARRKTATIIMAFKEDLETNKK